MSTIDLSPLYHTKLVKANQDLVFVDQVYGCVCYRETNKIIMVLRVFNLNTEKTEHITCEFDGPTSEDLRQAVEDTDDVYIYIQFGETKYGATMERFADPKDWCKWDVTIRPDKLLPISIDDWHEKYTDANEVGTMFSGFALLNYEYNRWFDILNVATYIRDKQEKTGKYFGEEEKKLKQVEEKLIVAGDKDYYSWCPYEEDGSNIEKIKETIRNLDAVIDGVREGKEYQ